MIQVKDLCFSYVKKPFIENMNFNVQEGEIFGFLGPSGAGKSTLQKILIGMLPSYRGNVTVMGDEVRSAGHSYYEQIGIDFEFPSLYEKMTARENLKFFASLYQKADANIDELLENVGLGHDAEKKAGDFSKGMKSRLNFIKALVHQPKLLFLDEPTSGLDPLMQSRFVALVGAEKKRGKTILLSSHMFEEVERTCDRIGIIRSGKLVAVDSVEALRERHVRSYTVTLDTEEMAVSFAKDFGGMQAGRQVTVTTKQSLEEIFMTYYGGGENA